MNLEPLRFPLKYQSMIFISLKEGVNDSHKYFEVISYIERFG